MKIDVRLDEEVEIEFGHEGVTTSAAVSQVGEGLYRLNSVPLFVDGVTYGDVIEAEIVSEHQLRFVRVASNGGWRVHTSVLAKERSESDVQAVVDEAMRRGGHCERVFGGVLLICLPPDCTDWEPWR